MHLIYTLHTVEYRQSVKIACQTCRTCTKPSCQEMRVSGVRPFLTIPHILLYTTALSNYQTTF